MLAGEAGPRIDPSGVPAISQRRPVAILAAPERFVALLDRERVIDHPLERRLYSRDGSIAEGDRSLVVLPETTEEVVAACGSPASLTLAVAARVRHRALWRGRAAGRGSCCRWRA